MVRIAILQEIAVKELSLNLTTSCVYVGASFQITLPHLKIQHWGGLL